MIDQTIEVIKRNGATEQFAESKLSKFFESQGVSGANAAALAQQIRVSIQGSIHADDLYGIAVRELQKLGRIIPHISLKNAVAQLGPTGFPFERFVGRIFEAQGYRVIYDQLIRGACTTHEVDIIALKDNEVVACEIKFHNELGIKSDVKVALYIKARFEDLTEAPVMIEGKSVKITRGMLITNTKFTESAIEYAMCKRLDLVGWNTPIGHGLERLITQYHLVPITAIVSLPHEVRTILIQKGIVTIVDIQKQYDTFEFVLKQTLSEATFAELNSLITEEVKQLFKEIGR